MIKAEVTIRMQCKHCENWIEQPYVLEHMAKYHGIRRTKWLKFKYGILDLFKIKGEWSLFFICGYAGKLWISIYWIYVDIQNNILYYIRKGGEKMNENMLTVKEVANQLGLAEITIRQWIQHKKILSVKLTGSRSRRIPQSEIERIKKGE